MARKRIAIVGAGGNAREIAAIVRDVTDAGQEDFEFVGFVVSDETRIGPHDSRDLLLGDFDCLCSHAVDALAIGCGDPPQGYVCRRSCASSIQIYSGLP